MEERAVPKREPEERGKEKDSEGIKGVWLLNRRNKTPWKEREECGDENPFAGCVLSIWTASTIQPSRNVRTDKKERAYTKTFRQRYCMSEEEFYCEQPTGPFGAAFLISKTLVLTSANNVETENNAGERALDKLVFVAGWQYQRGKAPPRMISPDRIYKGIEIVRYQRNGVNNFAVVKLNRPVKVEEGGKSPVMLTTRSPSKAIPKGVKTQVVGYPAGLPLKVGSSVQDQTLQKSPRKNKLQSPLGPLVANPGSPVFNAKTKLVEGMVIDGENFFQRIVPTRAPRVHEDDDDDDDDDDEDEAPPVAPIFKIGDKAKVHEYFQDLAPLISELRPLIDAEH
jgi:V8-like Glu-specific endopeptidase